MGLNLFGWAFLLGSPRAVVNHPRWGSSPCLRLGHRGCKPADLDLYCFFLHLVTFFGSVGGQAHPRGGYFGIWDPLWGTCLRLGPGMLSPGGFVPAATQHPCGTLPAERPPPTPSLLSALRGPAATGSRSGFERPEREPRHRRRFAIKQPHFPKSP